MEWTGKERYCSDGADSAEFQEQSVTTNLPGVSVGEVLLFEDGWSMALLQSCPGPRQNQHTGVLVGRLNVNDDVGHMTVLCR
jgi:hypothetical protein